MAYNWNWGVFLQPTATGDDTYLGWMFYGFKMTIALSLSAWLIALAVGAVVGILRTVPNKLLAGIATAYVEVFRNIPLLVQLFLWYFVMPELLPEQLGNAFKQTNPILQQFLASMVCLALFTSARVAEHRLPPRVAAWRCVGPATASAASAAPSATRLAMASVLPEAESKSTRILFIGEKSGRREVEPDGRSRRGIRAGGLSCRSSAGTGNGPQPCRAWSRRRPRRNWRWPRRC